MIKLKIVLKERQANEINIFLISNDSQVDLAISDCLFLRKQV